MLISSNKKTKAYTFLISEMLSESPAIARKIVSEWERSKKISRDLWLAAANSPGSETKVKILGLDIQGLRELTTFLAHKPDKGVVLCTIHMGNYLHAIAAILGALSDRKAFIVRQKEASKEETMAFQNLADAMNIDFEVVRSTDQAVGLKVLRNLKRGSIVVMLYDLPFSYGDTTQVEVFGRLMHWVKGPATYAAMANAYVLPFFAYTSAGRPKCDLNPILQLSHLEEDSKRGTQLLASLAESYIRRFPSQWLHWYWIPDMVAGKVQPPEEPNQYAPQSGSLP